MNLNSINSNDNLTLKNNAKSNLQTNSKNFDTHLQTKLENSQSVGIPTRKVLRMQHMSLKPESLAQEDFNKALKALDKLVYAGSEEKFDFETLSKEAKKDLLHHLAKNLQAAEGFYNEELQYLKVEIYQQEKYTWAAFSYENMQGEEKHDFFNLKDAKLGTPPLGDKDAQRPLEELAKDYVEGKEDNYFGFLKRTRTNNEPEGAYTQKDLQAMEEEVRVLKAKNKLFDQILGQGVNGELYINIANKTFIQLQRGQTQILRPQPSANVLAFEKMIDNLIEDFFEDKKTFKQ